MLSSAFAEVADVDVSLDSAHLLMDDECLGEGDCSVALLQARVQRLAAHAKEQSTEQSTEQSAENAGVAELSEVSRDAAGNHEQQGESDENGYYPGYTAGYHTGYHTGYHSGYGGGYHSSSSHYYGHGPYGGTASGASYHSHTPYGSSSGGYHSGPVVSGGYHYSSHYR